MGDPKHRGANQIGYWKVVVTSKRTGLAFTAYVHATNAGEADMKGYQVVKRRKGGFWPSAGSCRVASAYYGKTAPDFDAVDQPIEHNLNPEPVEIDEHTRILKPGEKPEDFDEGHDSEGSDPGETGD